MLHILAKTSFCDDRLNYESITVAADLEKATRGGKLSFHISEALMQLKDTST